MRPALRSMDPSRLLSRLTLLALLLQLAGCEALAPAPSQVTTIEASVTAPPAPPSATLPPASPTALPEGDVKLGQGSFTTKGPSGAKGPADMGGNPAPPALPAGASGPTPTNDWWSSLGWKWQMSAGQVNTLSAPMYPHPLAVKVESTGLGISYPTTATIAEQGKSYQMLYKPDLIAGVDGLLAEEARPESWGDWHVTALWEQGARKLHATFGHGLPFVYFTAEGGAPVIEFTATPTHIWAGPFDSCDPPAPCDENDYSPVMGITFNGHHYGIFSLSSTRWHLDGLRLTQQNGLLVDNHYAIAVLPDDKPETLALFARHAFAFVTDTRVSWAYDQATARVRTTFEVETTPVEGEERGTLLALYRHQWLNTDAALTAQSYVSPRGAMKLLQGNGFTTELTLGGVLPALPDVGGYDKDELRDLVDQVFKQPDLFPPSPESTKDSYWTNKALLRLAQLVPIAEHAGHEEARDRFLQALREKLQDWLTSSDGANLFYYDRAWGTLIGHPANYGSDTALNDHHFHYAGFVFAAATLAQYDPAWAADEAWGEMVELLIRDVANWDHADQRFPLLRTFDPYAGHSWASGHAGFETGNNQESSSEAANFAAAVLLWGAATGDTTVRDLGAYLYATEVSAIEQYWFDLDDAVFPPDFDHVAVGIVWGSGGAYTTWFGDNPEYIHGINFLPLTGASLYLGRRPDYVAANYAELVKNRGYPEILWQDIIWGYQAFADPRAALEKFETVRYATEYGESKAHTYHWLHNLAALGAVDASVTADVPTYAVFKQGSTTTHVAYNPGPEPLTVTFSDGARLTVPPRSTATD